MFFFSRGEGFSWELGVEDETASTPARWRPVPVTPARKQAKQGSHLLSDILFWWLGEHWPIKSCKCLNSRA
jgi:hypothetical protein